MNVYDVKEVMLVVAYMLNVIAGNDTEAHDEDMFPNDKTKQT